VVFDVDGCLLYTQSPRQGEHCRDGFVGRASGPATPAGALGGRLKPLRSGLELAKPFVFRYAGPHVGAREKTAIVRR